MNRWNIPEWLEREVRDRDSNCIYCRCQFTGAEGPRRSRPSWEHIINDARIIARENVALCCIGCNASKGAKLLSVWLTGKYCTSRGITPLSIAAVAQAVLHAATPVPQHGA